MKMRIVLWGRKGKDGLLKLTERRPQRLGASRGRAYDKIQRVV